MTTIYLLTMSSVEEVECAKARDSFDMILYSGHPFLDLEKAKAAALEDLKEYVAGSPYTEETQEVRIDWKPDPEDPANLTGSSEADKRDQTFLIRTFEVEG